MALWTGGSLAIILYDVAKLFYDPFEREEEETVRCAISIAT
jgi:hypothetical protein